MSIPAIVDTHAVTSVTPLPPTPRTPDSEKQGSFSDKEVDAIYPSYATSSQFSSEENLVNTYYEPPASYESKHRWDPKATWTVEEETGLRRKLGEWVIIRKESDSTC